MNTTSRLEHLRLKSRPLVLTALTLVLTLAVFTGNYAFSDNQFAATNTIKVGVASDPHGLAFNPTNNFMYVANSVNDNVVVIDGSKVVKTIPVGDNPTGIAFNPSNNKLYVTNHFANTVSVIEGTAVTDTIAGFSCPLGVAFNPMNEEIYVANFCADNVSVIDGIAINDTVTTGNTPYWVAFNPSNGKMYVTNHFDNTVSIIDGTTVTDTVPVEERPTNIEFNAANNKMYITNALLDTVSVMDGSVITDTISVGQQPQGIALNPTNNKMYVVNSLSNTVSVIDGTTIIDTVTKVPTGTWIAFNPANNKMYVTNQGGTVTIIDQPAYLKTQWTRTQVWNNNALEVRANMKANIPEDGNHGAFGYAWMTDGLNNVLIVVTHLGLDDSSHEDVASGFHTHVVDLMAPTSICGTHDAEVDMIGSAANAAFDSDYEYFVQNTRVEVRSVPTADLGDSGVETFAVFTVTPVNDPSTGLHLCVDVVDTV